mmetsp:Transcript_31435/g.92162  ORF Transcript_31435/g.92162 Transcript_31435/m.92162 type:complete len:362 (-) Transcript_31435:175-1260(-)
MDSTPEQIAEGESVVRVLAAVLERLIGANSLLAQTDPGKVTKFHALKAPGIGIHQYLERIHKYASCSTECFVLALIYIDRLIQRNNFLLTDLNVHRVVITAVLLAAKFFDDAYYNNAYYAKVGGVLISEMNSLEVEFLFRINFSLHVDSEVFQKYRAELAVHAASAAAGENQQPLAAAVGLATGGGSSQFLPDTFQVHQAPSHLHQSTHLNNALAPFQAQQPTMVPQNHPQQQVPLPTLTTHPVPLAHHNHQVPMVQQNVHHTVPVNPQTDYVHSGQQQHLHHKHQIPIATQANSGSSMGSSLYGAGPPQTANNTGTNNAYGVYGGNGLHMPQHPSASSVVVGGSSEHFVHATASSSGYRR